MTERASHLVRWGAKSGGGLLANLALLTLWVDGLGFAAWWAVGINWMLIAIVGYTVTDQWVYRDLHSPKSVGAHIRQFVGLQGVMTSAKVVNYILYLGLLGVVDYRIAWTSGAVLSFGLSFVGSRYLWSGDTPLTAVQR